MCSAYTKKPIEKRIAHAGTIPASIGNLTELYVLQLHGNDALEKPPGCPVDDDGDMCYGSKENIADFFRCLV